jgi:hypothetical protein
MKMPRLAWNRLTPQTTTVEKQLQIAQPNLWKLRPRSLQPNTASPLCAGHDSATDCVFPLDLSSMLCAASMRRSSNSLFRQLFNRDGRVSGHFIARRVVRMLFDACRFFTMKPAQKSHNVTSAIESHSQAFSGRKALRWPTTVAMHSCRHHLSQRHSYAVQHNICTHHPSSR